MITEYLKKGKCIWCLKEKPVVEFYTKPHTIVKSLGSTNIGFDICDTCNSFLGTNGNGSYAMSVELAFKEIVNVMKLLLSNNLNETTYKTFRSVYFDYFHSKRTLKFRNTFRFNNKFITDLTRQFKKGIYEVFLQEYHRCVEDGLADKFNTIRNFVRFDKGDLPLYFLHNNGVYLVDEQIGCPTFSFPEIVLSEINNFGFYQMYLFGTIFFLEVTPRSEYSREIYLKKESKEHIGSGFVYSELRLMKYITDLDFTLRNLHQKTK
ncbi:MAG TPA: hypothetical protein VIK55_19945 [Paludibacter sp.]